MFWLTIVWRTLLGAAMIIVVVQSALFGGKF
jgi:hypothetical protein